MMTNTVDSSIQDVSPLLGVGAAAGAAAGAAVAVGTAAAEGGAASAGAAAAGAGAAWLSVACAAGAAGASSARTRLGDKRANIRPNEANSFFMFMLLTGRRGRIRPCGSARPVPGW